MREPEHPERELYLDAQWRMLREVVEERAPETIAINVSHTHAFSDGLPSGGRELLERALGPKWTARFVHAELLPLHYLAIRVPSMLPYYQNMMKIVHGLIATAFSSEVITPGETTTEDVVWWLRQRVHDRAMDSWFQPSVSAQPQRGDPRRRRRHRTGTICTDGAVRDATLASSLARTR